MIFCHRQDPMCVYVFFLCFPFCDVRFCCSGRIWRINTLWNQSLQSGCCLSGQCLQQHTHTYTFTTTTTVCVKTCGLCHSNQVWQRWMWVDVNKIFKQRWQIRFRVINAINVSVTDSFHTSYSEQGTDTNNYDSDKCQEYDLRNCCAALIDFILTKVSDQWQRV